MASTPSLSAAPYPGLRPFEIEESDIFFGRERQTDELLGTLQRNRFLAVIGPSGCGKSSLVRAGLISALETGFMADAGSRWRVAWMRPGDRPLRHLVRCLMTPALVGRDGGARPDAALFLEAALRRGPLGLIEVARESQLCADANLLLLVDQFEELFRFRSQGDPDEADAFVALLLATAAQSALPIYVILTMRSDFLGDCSLFPELPEAINRGTYLIPRLTREQCEAAVKGPARVCGGDIEPGLANRLLNDFGPDPDQLPLLQHALMRMWFQRTHPPPTDASSRIVLTVADYDRLGGLPRALSDHADEVMRELTPAQQRITTIIFQRLTERASGKRDTRSPARLGDVARVAGVSVAEAGAVVEAFRKEGRSFLAPLQGPLEESTSIDIGHESLIRQWKQLAAWVEDESESSRMYGRLGDTARLWEAGQAGLWSDPDLARALQWKQRANPTEAWASRYGQPGDFSRAMRFLAESEAEQERRERAARQARERTLRRARRLSMTLGAIIVALLGGLMFYWYGWVRDYGSYYRTYVKNRGEPAGIGALTAQQVRHRPWSLQIVRAGRFGHVRRAEALDSQGRPASRNNIGTYLAGGEETLQRRQVRWEFLYDDHGRVAHEVAYDKDGHRVLAFMYSPASADEGRVRVAHYAGADGYPMPTKDYGGGYVQIEYSPEGYEATITFRNALNEPRPGLDHAFGRRQTFDARGRVLEIVLLGPDGRPMIDEAGDSGVSLTWDEADNQVAYAYTNRTGGGSKTTYKYDDNGNEVEMAFFDDHDRPALSADRYHRVTRLRDAHGNVTEERYWNVDKAPALVTGCHAFRRAVDERGNTVQETCLSVDDRPTPGDNGVTVTTLRYDDHDNLLETAFLDVSGRPTLGNEGYSRTVYRYDDRGNEIERTHFGVDGLPATTRDGYSRITSLYDAHNNEIGRAYFGHTGQPVVIRANGRPDVISEGGRPHPFGYASLKRKVDENGNLVEEAYFDVNGQPKACWYGYAIWRATYDLSGNRIEESYFGLHGEHVESLDGYAVRRRQHDPLGRTIKVEYFGVRGEPVRSKVGVAGWTSAYDDQGNVTEHRFFDEDGKPALQLWNLSKPALGGYARETFTNDGRNRLLEHAYFGAKGEPVRPPDGSARGVNR